MCLYKSCWQDYMSRLNLPDIYIHMHVNMYILISLFFYICMCLYKQGYPGAEVLGGPYVPTLFTSDVLETQDEKALSTEGRCQYVLYHSFICVTWRICGVFGGPYVPTLFTSDVLETQDEKALSTEGRCQYILYHSFMRVTWRICVWIHIRSVRNSRWKWVFWGEVWICAVWLIRTCDLTHVCVNLWFILGVLETWGWNAVYGEGECEYVLCNSSIPVTLSTHVWIYTRCAADSRW